MDANLEPREPRQACFLASPTARQPLSANWRNALSRTARMHRAWPTTPNRCRGRIQHVPFTVDKAMSINIRNTEPCRIVSEHPRPTGAVTSAGLGGLFRRCLRPPPWLRKDDSRSLSARLLLKASDAAAFPGVGIGQSAQDVFAKGLGAWSSWSVSIRPVAWRPRVAAWSSATTIWRRTVTSSTVSQPSPCVYPSNPGVKRDRHLQAHRLR